MTNPSKVIGFLDLAGSWNPSLAFVMAGAILVGFFAFRLAANRPKALLGDVMRIPNATQIDRRLVLGGLTFGVGWGLAGYCPGPAVVSLATGRFEPVIFVLAMLGGMLIFEVLERFSAASQRRAEKLR
jgi:uncharacterized membrane protein YedE/YeeE